MHQAVPQRLVKEQALVLIGPQGCGKTQLAIELAKQHTPYRQIDMQQLLDEHLFHQALRGNPRTLIVDGFAESAEERTFVRTLAASRTWSFNMKRSKQVHTFKVPHLVFCADDGNPFLPTEQDRRFRVFTMPSGWKPRTAAQITYLTSGQMNVFGVDTNDRRFFVINP